MSFSEKTPPRNNREERRLHPHPIDLAKKQIAHILDEQAVDTALVCIAMGDLQADMIAGKNLELLAMLGAALARIQKTGDSGDLGRSVLHWHELIKGYLAVSGKKGILIYIELKKVLDTFPQEIKEQAASIGLISPEIAKDFDSDKILKDVEGNHDARTTE